MRCSPSGTLEGTVVERWPFQLPTSLPFPMRRGSGTATRCVKAKLMLLTPPTCLLHYPPLLSLTVIAFDVHNQHMHTHSTDTHTHRMHEHTHYCLHMKYTGVMCSYDGKTFCFVQVQCLHMYTPHGVKNNSLISHIMDLSIIFLFFFVDCSSLRMFLSCKLFIDCSSHADT